MAIPRRQREERQSRQYLCTRDDAPERCAHKEERHGEPERDADPAQLLPLLVSRPPEAHDERHSGGDEPGDDQPSPEEPECLYHGGVEGERVLDRRHPGRAPASARPTRRTRPVSSRARRRRGRATTDAPPGGRPA